MLEFRKLLPDDSQNYRMLRLESLMKAPESFGSSYEEESLIPRLRMEANIEKESSDQLMFGAYDNKLLVGICGFMRENQRKSRHRGVIVQMFVKEKYQGKGVGERLIRSIVKYAFSVAAVEQLTLGVVTTNEKALRLYEKLGFQEYGVHYKYFKIGDRYFDQKLMILYKENFNQEGAKDS
jgi:RimJ/RimL family protein N-acetyltransferase